SYLALLCLRRPPPSCQLFPYTTLFRSVIKENLAAGRDVTASAAIVASWARYAEGTGENGEEWPVVDRLHDRVMAAAARHDRGDGDRKSTRLNSSHVSSSYAVFCVNKKS